MEIKISVDQERKAVTKVEGTKELNPIELAVIFQQLAVSALSRIKLEPISKIIKPKFNSVPEGACLGR